MRDHNPIKIDDFNGLWARGGMDSCPPDHSPDCANVKFIQSGIQSRDGFDIYQNFRNVVRVYTYSQSTGDSLLILDSSGNIYHTASPTPNTPILTIGTMTDFAFVNYSGRAFISPNDGTKGLSGKYVYIYNGDGTAARIAGGSAISNSSKKPFFAVQSTNAGVTTAGIHVIAIIHGNTTGGGTYSHIGPEEWAVVTVDGTHQITLYNIPLGDVNTTFRKIIMTKALTTSTYNPAHSSLTYYVAATVNDNTTTQYTFDIADASLGTASPAYGGPGSIPADPTDGGALRVADSQTTLGIVDSGFRLYGIVSETNTGFLSSIGPEYFGAAGSSGVDAMRIYNIPVSSDPNCIARNLVCTRRITNYSGVQTDYAFYKIPGGRIADNVTTDVTLNFSDATLLDDWSYLLDLYPQIPSGAGLGLYHNRLVVWSTYSDTSLMLVSSQGEPESINQVDGVLVTPRNGLPITNVQEYRDVMYVMKQNQTFSFTDNGGVPATWNFGVIDNGIGASLHGISRILDTGGVNTDFMFIVDWSGILLFNGTYIRPELTWKIKDYWASLDKTLFNKIQIYNDSVSQILYVSLPNNKILMGDYSNGLNHQNIRWTTWNMNFNPTTITMVNKNILAIGSSGPTSAISGVYQLTAGKLYDTVYT